MNGFDAQTSPTSGRLFIDTRTHSYTLTRSVSIFPDQRNFRLRSLYSRTQTTRAHRVCDGIKGCGDVVCKQTAYYGHNIGFALNSLFRLTTYVRGWFMMMDPPIGVSGLPLYQQHQPGTRETSRPLTGRLSKSVFFLSYSAHS